MKLLARTVRDLRRLAAPDVAFGVGAMTPFVLMHIINRPGMPVAVIYLVVWQWGQIFARVVQTFPDGEALGGGLFGANVERAYWYTWASAYKKSDGIFGFTGLERYDPATGKFSATPALRAFRRLAG